jgi:thymidylate synthase (FAD)
MQDVVEYIEKAIGDIYEYEGIDSEEDFSTKKVITSAVRRIAPLGMATEEGWSANIRALRHIIEMRTAFGAEEEIRIIVNQIAFAMQRECPLLFGDYILDEHDDDTIPPAWTTPFRKV